MSDSAVLSLLEFVGCCFEKNEFMRGLERHNVYNTHQIAQQQLVSLVREATALFGAPESDETGSDGVRNVRWPALHVLQRGLAVLVFVHARMEEAFCVWNHIPAETWEKAGDDLNALYRIVYQRPTD